jgi:hypothetical protein
MKFFETIYAIEHISEIANFYLALSMLQLMKARILTGWVTKSYHLELLRALEDTLRKLLVPAAFAVVSTHSSFKEG